MMKRTAVAVVYGRTFKKHGTPVGMPPYECVRLAEQMLDGDGPNVTDEQHAERVSELADAIQLTVDTWFDGTAS
jgi:hypothetical protein